jgi:hypothetical protein
MPETQTLAPTLGYVYSLALALSIGAVPHYEHGS